MVVVERAANLVFEALESLRVLEEMEGCCSKERGCCFAASYPSRWVSAEITFYLGLGTYTRVAACAASCSCETEPASYCSTNLVKKSEREGLSASLLFCY